MSTPRYRLLPLILLTVGCQAPQPMATVPYVDLDRFMGDWYVIASIPTPFERDAHNAIEQYAATDDGYIATTFSFNKDGFDGPRKTMHAKGFVLDADSNARWGMQFLWPIKADYRIVHLNDDYTVTIIGRERRDYVWLMSRSLMSESAMQQYVERIAQLGYDTKRLQRVPHQSGP